MKNEKSSKNLQLILEFLLYINDLPIMSSVIFLSMLMILISTVNVTMHLGVSDTAVSSGGGGGVNPLDWGIF